MNTQTKIVSELPQQIEPKTRYIVEQANGIVEFISDDNGNIKQLNSSVPSKTITRIETIKNDGAEKIKISFSDGTFLESPTVRELTRINPEWVFDNNDKDIIFLRNRTGEGPYVFSSARVRLNQTLGAVRVTQSTDLGFTPHSHRLILWEGQQQGNINFTQFRNLDGAWVWNNSQVNCTIDNKITLYPQQVALVVRTGTPTVTKVVKIREKNAIEFGNVFDFDLNTGRILSIAPNSENNTSFRANDSHILALKIHRQTQNITQIGQYLSTDNAQIDRLTDELNQLDDSYILCAVASSYTIHRANNSHEKLSEALFRFGLDFPTSQIHFNWGGFGIKNAPVLGGSKQGSIFSNQDIHFGFQIINGLPFAKNEKEPTIKNDDSPMPLNGEFTTDGQHLYVTIQGRRKRIQLLD